MTKFFITHSWKDIEFARRLFNDLTAHGLEGWLDDKTLQGGHRLAEEINKGLEWCDVYIPVLSRAALESPWCWEEINAAITLANRRERRGRPRIIPVLVEECELPALLAGRLYFNFANRYDAALNELLSKGFGIPVLTCETFTPALVPINTPTPTPTATATPQVPIISSQNADQIRELATLSGHTRWVRSVAFAPDGQMLASGSDDNTIKLWNVANGREVRTLSGHTDWVRSVAFAPDGRTLASGSSDETIKLWDVASGREVRTLSGHTMTVTSVAFAPNGRVLVSGSDDHTIKLWDVSSGREVRTLNRHTHYVRSVAFAPDGRMLASGSYDGTVRLWGVR